MKPVIMALAAASSLLAVQTAQAQDTLVVGGYGGSFETLMKEVVFPEFEKTHDVTIQFVAGNSTENLARLQAQKGNQELDVVILDDGPMYQADALGFCAPMSKGAVFDDVYDLAKLGPNSIGVGFVATGFTYNTEWFEREGWDPPASWEDLKDPKYEGILSIPPISNTYGLHTLIMMARLNGGGEKDIDPGFEVMADEVAPNVLVFEPSSGKMSELFQSQEIALSIWGSGRTKSLADTGFPAKFAYPKEGAVALMLAACPVVDSNVSEAANEFIQYLLTPEIQVKLADVMGSGPVNRKAELTEEQASFLPYGPEQIENLVAVDWDTINPNREEWTKRWAREVER
ncbi:ABC transporter substrate-binding protein [Afifella marina]|uniref:Putative spermidine/putrescine transport system substrate-binding protein n=1 Tax=Afifella marina DSM 2698 TaxID=1120955 RepID=A0A1G5NQR6_AFIMA|nr:ABC transporter substrate-binding protein [Afifella marina]MBK1624723.1 branched-chain amino acid ABC transporter substrate-binding protein [Afifella marina DSM 2698]MBK1628535.1 branched-chain amino acid ABC transporter substrate-binding protein [Afifella marina]MBK5915894.1 branched-chain amino acid ABC transporter substrate-binding protein [Afifella marina]RAI20682.1 branched-chain amino acid ABC transporter substrate-binding protein [Afifella marina DSM 2698]SCZ39723.1 putative spermidi